MKILCTIAASIIIFWMLLFILFMVSNKQNNDVMWNTQTSPITNICYEVYRLPIYGGVTLTMSPVNDKYCNKETK